VRGKLGVGWLAGLKRDEEGLGTDAV